MERALALAEIPVGLPEVSVRLPDIPPRLPEIPRHLPGISVRLPEISVLLPRISVKLPRCRKNRYVRSVQQIDKRGAWSREQGAGSVELEERSFEPQKALRTGRWARLSMLCPMKNASLFTG